MSMTREDMLRELELLPVWQLRPEAVLAKHVDLPQPITTQANPAPVLIQAAEPVMETLAEPMLISSEPEARDLQAAPAQAAPKIATAWLLYCPEADVHEAHQTMLSNIIHAMQLLQNEYVLVHNAQDLTRYQAQKVLLFGLAAFHALTGRTVSNLEALRGVPQSVEGYTVWVTCHPAQMLANPALKRAAWQDICAALAHR